jgi:hypothetical protein
LVGTIPILSEVVPFKELFNPINPLSLHRGASF